MTTAFAGQLATTAPQAVIAVAGGSAGLLANMIHDFADVFTAIQLWVAFSLVGRGLLLFVVFSAISAGRESYHKFLSPERPTLIGSSIIAAVAEGHHSRIDSLTSLAAGAGLMGVVSACRWPTRLRASSSPSPFSAS